MPLRSGKVKKDAHLQIRLHSQVKKDYAKALEYLDKDATEHLTTCMLDLIALADALRQKSEREEKKQQKA